MAETATVGILKVLLKADTAELDTATSKSELKIKSFTQSVERMVAGFNGGKIVAEATKITAAINQLEGGIKRLTQGEINRIAPTIQAAMDKFKALGQQAPADIAKLSGELSKAQGAASSLGGAFSRLTPIAGAFGIALSGAALIQFARSTLEAADSLVKLSDKTGIAIEPLQELKFIAEQSGNSVEQITAAVSMMQRRLADGNKDAVDGLRSLGLSIENIKALSPDQQFLAIAREVAKIEDPMKRAQVATEIFGRAGAEVLPTLIAKVDELAAQAPKMSEKAVKAFDDVGDAISRATTAAGTFAGETTATILDAYTRLGQAATALITGDFGRIPHILADTADVNIPRAPAAPPLRTASGAGVALSEEAQEKAARELTKAIEENIRKAEEFRKRQDALFGRDLIARSQDYVRLLGDVTNISKLSIEKKAELRAAVESALAAYQRLGLTAPESLKVIDAATRPLLISTRQWATVELKGAIDALTPFAASVRSLGVDSVPQLSTAIHSSRLGFVELKEAVSDSGDEIDATRERMSGAKQSTGEWTNQLSELSGALAELAQVSGDSFGEIVRGIATIVVSFNTATKAVEAMQGGFSKLRGENKNVGAGLLEMTTGALGAASALGQATGQGSTLNRTIGGIATGAKIGSMFGPWGTAIGAAAGAVVGLVRGLSQISPEIKKSREELTKFQEGLRNTLTDTQKAEAGMEGWKMDVIAVRNAYLATGRTAEDALAIVRQLWDTDHPERSKAAIEQINKVLAEQKDLLEKNKKAATDLYEEILSFAGEQGGIPAALRDHIDQLIQLGLLTDEQADKLRGLSEAGSLDWKQLTEDVETFKGRIDQLGPAFQQARIDDTSKKYLNAIDRLLKGGASMGAVLFDAKEELGELVADAIKSGATLPAQFEPWIKELLRTGQLLDENGKEITDISRLKFGATMETEAEKVANAWQKIIDKIDEFISKLMGIPKEINTTLNLDTSTNGRPTGGDDPTREPFPTQDAPLSSAFSSFRAGALGAGLSLSTAALSGLSVPPTFSPTIQPAPVVLGASGGDTYVIPVIQSGSRNINAVVDDVVKQLPRRTAANQFGVRTALVKILGD